MPPRDADLSDPERRLIEAARSGLVCDLSQPGLGIRPGADPNSDVVIRAWVLHDLCVDAPHPKGVRLRGGQIVGTLDFDWETLGAPLVLDQCQLEEPLSLRDAIVKSIKLTGCSLSIVIADRMRSAGVVSMQGSAIRHGISLDAATLGASLILDGSAVSGSEAALSARLMTVGGDIVLRQTSCDGAVHFPLASVRGDIFLRDLTIRSADLALDANRTEIGGFVTMEGVDFLGYVNLSRSRIGADLRIVGARISTDETEEGLAAEDLTADAVLIVDTDIRGSIRLARSQLTSLRILGGSVRSPAESPALLASGISIAGSAQIVEAEFNNSIDLTSARISGRLSILDSRSSASGTRVDLYRSEIGETEIQGPFRYQTQPGQEGGTTSSNTTARTFRFPHLTNSQVSFAQAALLSSVVLVGLAPVVFLAVLIGQHRYIAGWLFGLAGLAIVSLTALSLTLLQRRAQVVEQGGDVAIGGALRPAVTFGTYWTRLRPRALQATLTSQAAIDRIGQSLARRLIAGNLRNYSGSLSIGLSSPGASMPPSEDGSFLVLSAVPLSISVTLGAKPIAGTFAQTVSVTDGMDAPVVDFDLIVSVEDLDATPHFTERGTVSVTPDGRSGRVSMDTTAPSVPGAYLLVVEVLQQNRLVHVLRAPVKVAEAIANE